MNGTANLGQSATGATQMAKLKYYVGCKTGGRREVFKYCRTPVSTDHLPYFAVIGPFRTAQGASFMARFGRVQRNHILLFVI
jgi:hypothetical protein